MTYLVIAYRWGWTNNHQYQVYCGPDKTKALALADSEANDRGGKYGCAVYAFNEDGTEYALEDYFASSYDEKEPFHNYRLDMFETLGHVLRNAAHGTVMLPDPEKPGVLKPVKVEPPEWVISEVKRAEEIAEAVESFQKKKEKAEIFPATDWEG